MASKTMDVAEVQAHFQEVFDGVERGDQFFVKKDNRLIAEIIPTKSRRLGLHKGAVTCTDDFDDALPESFWMGH